MYLNLFKDLRLELAQHYGLLVEEPSGSVFNPSPESIPLRDIQLFNNQLDRTIAIAPLVLIDFGRLEFTEITKGHWVSPLKVRFYVVSDSISLSDGQRHDCDVERHEGICEDIIRLFHRTKFTTAAKPLVLASMERNLDYAGWMVSLLEFDTRLELA